MSNTQDNKPSVQQEQTPEVETQTPMPFEIERFEKDFSENKLTNKLWDTAKHAGLKVVYAVLLLYYVASSSDVPTSVRAKIYGALGYFILPTDLLADFLPGGYVDDFAALIIVIRMVLKSITPDIERKAKDKLHDWFGEYDEKKLNNLW